MAGLNEAAFVFGGCETMPIWLFFLSSSFSTQTKGNRHLTQNVDLINSSLPAWYLGTAWKSSIRCTFRQFFNLEIRLRGRSMSNVIVIVGDLFVQTALPVVFSVGVVLPIDHCRNMEGGCGGGEGSYVNLGSRWEGKQVCESVLRHAAGLSSNFWRARPGLARHLEGQLTLRWHINVLFTFDFYSIAFENWESKRDHQTMTRISADVEGRFELKSSTGTFSKR